MDYIRTKTIPEVLEALGKWHGSARIIAGATDILLDMDSGKVKADALVDIMNVRELKELKMEDGKIVIGGGVTLSQIAKSELIKKHLPSLAKGAASVGSVQIRNVATLAGNVVTAQPAADGAMALAPLEPEFEIQGPKGSRTCGMEKMYAGFGKSAVDSSRELVVRIKIPVLRPSEAASFIRLELRKSLSLPMLNVGAKVQTEKGIVKAARITMGPVGVGPKRAAAAEEWLQGRAFTLKNMTEAGMKALEDANPRSNPLRGSREYRLKTLPVLVKRALIDIDQQLNMAG